MVSDAPSRSRSGRATIRRPPGSSIVGCVSFTLEDDEQRKRKRKKSSMWKGASFDTRLSILGSMTTSKISFLGDHWSIVKMDLCLCVALFIHLF